MGNIVKGITKDGFASFLYVDFSNQIDNIRLLTGALNENLYKITLFCISLGAFCEEKNGEVSVSVKTNGKRYYVLYNGTIVKGKEELCEEETNTVTVVKSVSNKILNVGNCSFNKEIEESFSQYYESSEQDRVLYNIECNLPAKRLKGIFVRILPGASNENIISYSNGTLLPIKESFNFFSTGAACVSEKEVYFKCDCTRKKNR